MSCFPNKNNPNVEMVLRIGPGMAKMKLLVGDYKLFIDSLLEIKSGGSKIFFQQDGHTRVEVEIVNHDKRDRRL